MEHPKFRAAYDLLELRAGAENNGELQRLTKWWGEFGRRAAGAKDMLNDLGDDPAPRRRHRRPRKRAPRRVTHDPVYIALGSNLASPLAQVQAAIRARAKYLTAAW